MFKKYRITSKARFLIFMALMIIVCLSSVRLIMGLDNAVGASMKAYNTVTVEDGDTMWTIAKDRYGSNVDLREKVYNIQKVNHRKNANLEKGEILLIPVD